MKNTTKHLALIFGIFACALLYSEHCTAEENVLYTPRDYSIVPPAPTVGQFFKYKDYPVDYFHGVPEISFPLYTLKYGSMEVPITLSYHGGGIRVEHTDGNAGLGWTVSYGAQISHTLAGAPDDANLGSMHGLLHLNNDEGRQYWHLTNRQGSVMALLDSDGNTHRRSAHYPSGTPFVLDGDDTAVPDAGLPDDRHHIGNRWVGFGGLDWYDNTARMHDPLLCHFTAPDPHARDFTHLSPWSHCAANPVFYVDPDGKKPTPRAAALMAKHVYGGRDAASVQYALDNTGWRVSGFKTSIQKNAPWYGDGLNSELYEHKKEDGSYEYAYVFAGTNSLTDAAQDALQLKGESSQYSSAIANAKTLVRELGDRELTFIGHSLGGGEAAASSMATGKLAITFNPATVSTATISKHGLGKADKVFNYITIGKRPSSKLSLHVGGDPLNNIQSH